MLAYHDTEWGVPVRDDRALFAKFVLDGFQAGLSWKTILHRREHFLRVFEGFDPERLAAWDEGRIAAALTDPGIIRNRQKVVATVTNARAFLKVMEAGSFSDLLWSFTGGRARVNRWTADDKVPAETDESRAMSKALRARGFGFAGPTICYAFMQAVGMVNDHLVSCFRHAELSSGGADGR
jgi:DNA-3-methyladenine glycosylase I